ncbi:MAG: recombinase family protein [Aureliella sp.]
MNRERKKETVRCAIYTRKSTEEGLDQEFNSLDAQRDAGEAFITSQQSEGWMCLDARYDDGGFSGGNLERPAMKRLMKDIETGKIDCVVVYKVDRLSRSLLDFSRLMETFEKHNVAFVSVTQQFNTASSMGRLILNVLLSFAQFEREMISERTRDKIAATRRKGKWCGGVPVFGFTIEETKLVVVPHEAERVRQIFHLYQRTHSLLETAKEANRRGWRTKQWTTRKGTTRGGLEYDKNRIYQMLTNVTYIGKLTYKDEVHEGQHEAIVDPEVFEQVGKLLRKNGRVGTIRASTNFDGVLRGILRCANCNRAMRHTSTGRGTKRYRYYVCGKAEKQGFDSCPSPSIPARQIEGFVVEELRVFAGDDKLIHDIYERCHEQYREDIDSQRREAESISKFLKEDHAEIAHLLATSAGPDLIETAQSRIDKNETRLKELHELIENHRPIRVSHASIRKALGELDQAWETMPPRDRCRLMELLIERIDFDGSASTLDITFHPAGLASLGQDGNFARHLTETLK